MAGVAGFTMVSGLLIIIIERTSMIGVLKSLGANNTTIRKVFLWFSVFLIGKGMLWGNAIGLAFYFLQKWFGIFKLDPETYYMDTVPVSFSILLFLLLNIGTLLASVLMLLRTFFPDYTHPSCQFYEIRIEMPHFIVLNATPQQVKCHTSWVIKCGICSIELWHLGR